MSCFCNPFTKELCMIFISVLVSITLGNFTGTNYILGGLIHNGVFLIHENSGVWWNAVLHRAASPYFMILSCFCGRESWISLEETSTTFSHALARSLLYGLNKQPSAQSFQSCLTLCDPMAYSPPGSPVCGVLRARILEWVAMPCSRGSSPPGDPTHGALTALAGRFVTTSASWEVVSVNSKGDWQINVRTTSGLLHRLFFKD